MVTTVGTIGVSVTGGAFSGTLTVGGANASDFQISNGNTLETTGALAPGNYSITITATMTGAEGSPFTLGPITLTAVAPVNVPTAWNPLDQVGMSLSNSNSTASTNTTTPAGVRSNNSKTTGSFYAEFLLNSAGVVDAIGLANASWVETSQLGSGTASLGIYANGVVKSNGVQVGATAATWTSGTMGMAFDLTTEKVFFTVDGVNWDAPSSGDNPATNTGGYAIGFAGPVFLAFGATSQTVGGGSVSGNQTNGANLYPDPTFAGGTVSTTTLPTGCFLYGDSGLTCTLTAVGTTANGVPYASFQIAGTAAASQVGLFFDNTPVGATSTTVAYAYSLASGSTSGITSFENQWNQFNGTTYLGSTGVGLNIPTSTPQETIHTATNPATTTVIQPSIQLFYTASLAINITLTIAGLQVGTEAQPVIIGPTTASVSAASSVLIAGILLSDSNQPQTGNCTLSVSCTTGTVSFPGGATGNGTSSLQIANSYLNCQSAIATLEYTAGPNTGSDTIVVTFKDQLALSSSISVVATISAGSVLSKTLNTGQQPFVFAVPSGFQSWDNYAPTAPQNVQAVPSIASVEVSWSAPATGTAPTYQVNYRVHGTTAWTVFASGISGLSENVTGLSSSTEYDFEVIANNALGSATSAIVFATTTTATGTGPAASGTFVNVDFANNTAAFTGQVVSQYLWGAATDNLGNNEFAGCANATNIAILNVLQFPLLRFNANNGVMEAAYNGGSSITQSTFNTYFGNLINNIPKFMPANARIILGLGNNPPSNWSTAAAYGAACANLVGFLLSTNSTATGKPLPIYGFEVGNEQNANYVNIFTYFNAAAQAIHAVNGSLMMFGPSFSYQYQISDFATTCGGNVQVLDWHAYAYGPSLVPTLAQILSDTYNNSSPGWSGGLTFGTQSISNGTANWQSGGGPATTPFFLGEYNQNDTYGTGGANVYMQNGYGATFAAEVILSGLNAYQYMTMAGIWEATPPNSDYPMFGGTDVYGGGNNVCPAGWFLSKAAEVLYGNRVALTVASGGTGLWGMAVFGGPGPSNYAVLLINPTSAAIAGQVALSHWPQNGTGNGIANLWTCPANGSPYTSPPTESTVTVTAGIAASISVPAYSHVVLYNTGSLPGDLTGTTALRIADMMEIFGVNCYPDGQDGAGAAASASSYISRLNQICGGSGMGMSCRIYANVESTDTAFVEAVCAGVVNTRFTICPSYTESTVAVTNSDVTALASSGYLLAAEGDNEPSNASVWSGGANPTSTQCLADQESIWANANPLGVTVMMPSVSDTGSNTYLVDYTDGSEAAFVAHSNWYNGHDYPNSGAINNDMARRSDSLGTITGLPGGITEFHPLLYNNQGNNLSAAQSYTGIAILSGFIDHHLKALIWWSQYDYPGFSPPTGLFTGYSSTLSLAGLTVQAMFQLNPETSSSLRHTFQTSKLSYSVSGMPGPAGFSSLSGGRTALTQASTGIFDIWLWNEQNTVGGTASPWVVNLLTTVLSMTAYKLTSATPLTQLQTVTNTNTITVNVAPGDVWRIVVNY